MPEHIELSGDLAIAEAGGSRRIIIAASPFTTYTITIPRADVETFADALRNPQAAQAAQNAKPRIVIPGA